LPDLTRQLDNVGPVNLDAVHEYDDSKNAIASGNQNTISRRRAESCRRHRADQLNHEETVAETRPGAGTREIVA